MNVNNKIIDTLKYFGYPIKPDVYKLSSTEKASDKYFTFNYEDDRGEIFEDNKPIIDTAYLQIHFFSPRTFNNLTIKKQVRSKLFQAGFSYPQISSFYEEDTDTNHLVFQCHIDGQSETEE